MRNLIWLDKLNLDSYYYQELVHMGFRFYSTFFKKWRLYNYLFIYNLRFIDITNNNYSRYHIKIRDSNLTTWMNACTPFTCNKLIISNIHKMEAKNKLEMRWDPHAKMTQNGIPWTRKGWHPKLAEILFFKNHYKPRVKSML